MIFRLPLPPRPSPGRLPARQREGHPCQLVRGELPRQADAAAAEPGQQQHPPRAGRVAIGRHDQAIDGGEQTKKTGGAWWSGQSAEDRQRGIVPAPVPRVLLWVLRGTGCSWCGRRSNAWQARGRPGRHCGAGPLAGAPTGDGAAPRHRRGLAGLHANRGRYSRPDPACRSTLR